MHAWIPVIGQVLHLKREPDNCKDKYVVANVLEDCIVGHVSYNLAKFMSQFLSRDSYKHFARATGNGLENQSCTVSTDQARTSRKLRHWWKNCSI